MQSSIGFGVRQYVANSTSLITATDPIACPLPRRNVLVLEDDVDQLALLTQYLEALGLHTIATSTIAAASEALATESVHLAVLDVHLPDGSGLALCESVIDSPRHLDMPVIVLSSLTEQDLVRRSRASGARYFLTKPYDPNVLWAIIERALGSGLA